MASKSANASRLIKSYPIISTQMDSKRLEIILEQLESVLDNAIEGDIVEFGCYEGTTTLFMRRLLEEVSSPKALHAYDSFEGLPAKSIEDASVAGSAFKEGELRVSKRDLLYNFKKANLKPPIIHKKWFNQLQDKDVPDAIAFAFLDGDFFNSIKVSLEIVWPKLSKQGIVVIDDYMRSNLPGATRAVDDFFNDMAIKTKHQNNLAIVQKN